MGIVQKSSFQSSLLLGLGILLGFLTAGLLLPNFFNEEENGLLALLNSYSLIFSQVFILGIPTTIVKFYPHFKNESNKHNGLLSMVSFLVLASFLLFISTYYIAKPYLTAELERSPLFRQNYYYIIPVTFFFLFYNLFDAYSTAQVKSVRGFLLKDVLQRVFVLITIAVFVFYQITFSLFVFLYSIALSLPTLIFFFILLRENQFSLSPRWTELYSDNWRYMTKVSGYSLLLGISWVGVSNLDVIMIERLIDLKSAGIYGRNMFFGILVAIPYRAIHKASSGILSHAFKENNMEGVKDIYYKSTITQMILGSFILCGIWLNIHNIYQIIPASYASGKYVILFIGLGNLFTMIGGVNTAVVSFSPYYRWNTYFAGILLVLVVITNFLFIPVLGMTGAAVATMVSYLLYNFLLFLLLFKKYGFQPFGIVHLRAVLVTVLSFTITYFIPKVDFFITDVLLRSTVFTLLFTVFIYYSKVSPDINKMADQILKRLPVPIGHKKK